MTTVRRADVVVPSVADEPGAVQVDKAEVLTVPWAPQSAAVLSGDEVVVGQSAVELRESLTHDREPLVLAQDVAAIASRDLAPIELTIPKTLLAHAIAGTGDPDGLGAELAGHDVPNIDRETAQLFSPELLAAYMRVYDEQLFEYAADTPFPNGRLRAELSLAHVEGGLRSQAAGQMADAAKFNTLLPRLFDELSVLDGTSLETWDGRRVSLSVEDDTLLIDDGEHRLSVHQIEDGPKGTPAKTATGFMTELRRATDNEILSTATYWTRTRLQVLAAIVGDDEIEPSPRERFELVWFDGNVANRAVEMLAQVVDAAVGFGNAGPRLAGITQATKSAENALIGEHLKEARAVELFCEVAAAVNDPDHPYALLGPTVVSGRDALMSELQRRSRVGAMELELDDATAGDWLVFEPNRYMHAVSMEALKAGRLEVMLRRSDEVSATGRGELVRLSAKKRLVELNTERSSMGVLGLLIGLDRLVAMSSQVFDRPDGELERLLAESGVTPPPQRIGVIDAGFDVSHPAMAAHLAVNQNEVAGNGDDDDGNGYPDDVYGWDVALGRAQLAAPADQRTHYHGTHTAALATRGSAHLQAVAVRGWTSRGAEAKQIAESIDYAVSRGAQVINMSFDVRGKEDVDTVAAAMTRHPDVLFVKAAGNNGKELGREVDLDSAHLADLFRFSSENDLAARAVPNMIVVGGVRNNGTPWAHSNFSSTSVSLAAPAERVLSAVPGGRYRRESGTSFAAPQVANVAAKMRLLSPSLTPQELIGLLESSADVSAEVSKVCRSGVLNSDAALRAAAAYQKVSR